MAATIKAVTLSSGQQFVVATDLGHLFPGCKTGRDIIEEARVPPESATYATYSPKQNAWKPSTRDVRVAKALIHLEWALNNIQGLRAAGAPAPPAAPALPPLQLPQRPTPPGKDEAALSKLKIRIAEAALASALADERRSHELHAKRIEAIDRRAAAYERTHAFLCSMGTMPNTEEDDD